MSKTELKTILNKKNKLVSSYYKSLFQDKKNKNKLDEKLNIKKSKMIKKIKKQKRKTKKNN